MKLDFSTVLYYNYLEKVWKENQTLNHFIMIQLALYYFRSD